MKKHKQPYVCVWEITVCQQEGFAMFTHSENKKTFKTIWYKVECRVHQFNINCESQLFTQKTFKIVMVYFLLFSTDQNSHASIEFSMNLHCNWEYILKINIFRISEFLNCLTCLVALGVPHLCEYKTPDSPSFLVSATP